jgi:hypothetical protein
MGGDAYVEKKPEPATEAPAPAAIPETPAAPVAPEVSPEPAASSEA